MSKYWLTLDFKGLTNFIKIQKLQKRKPKNILLQNQTKPITVKSQAKEFKTSMLSALLSVLEFFLKNIVIAENASLLGSI